MFKTFSFAFVFAILLICSKCASAGLRIDISNGLPDNSNLLAVHCRSKDDDLGNHTLRVNQNFSWRFVPNFIPNTLFFCHFWWGQKSKVFDVYNQKKMGCECEHNGPTYSNTCFWQARADGFYYSKFTPPAWEKKSGWD